MVIPIKATATELAYAIIIVNGFPLQNTFAQSENQENSNTTESPSGSSMGGNLPSIDSRIVLAKL